MNIISIVLIFTLSTRLIFTLALSLSLILDPNIDETGNQLYKSNHGPSECCYDYCKFDDGLCSSKCDAIFNRNNETAKIASSSSTAKTTTTTTSTSYVDNYDEIDNDDGELTSKQARTNETSMTVMPKRGPYVKLDNGTVVLNDFSHMPGTMGMLQCPAILYSLPNVTQSAQQCSISQAQVSSTANCNSSFLSISILLLLLLMSHSTTLSITLLSLSVIVWAPLQLLLNQLAVVIRSTTTTNRKIIVTGS
jgi:hypothetical protein